MKDLRNKNRQKPKKSKIKNKGKEKLNDVEDESETNEGVQKQSFNRVWKGRATVRPLFEAMRGLTPQRKRVVREMGFGNLIDFPIVEILTKLAFYVVDILNTRKMTLECQMGDIVITPKTVKEVLGLPMERRKLEREGQREYNDPFLEEWKDQMNILTLIGNTLGSCENNSSLKFTVLRNVFEEDDVSDIDWCSYILKCASVSKVDWSKKEKKDVVYYGPVMFLM
nr:peptidase C48, SUMO/sentrin/Ubl1 [Tanacetum cinerariifolium]